MIVHDILFWVFSIAMLVCGLLVIANRNPVASALFLVMLFVFLAGLFVLLEAFFIAAIQVLVYAGAIMVLFLFVIMLLNLGRAGPSDIKGPWGKAVAGVAGLVLGGELLVFRLAVPPDALRLPPGAVAGTVAARGAVRAVAEPMFEGYLVPFEITSVLLLAAMVGAVVLAKRRL